MGIPRFKPGDRVWMFNENRRVYTHRDGTRSISPVYREHFVPYRVLEVKDKEYLLCSGAGHPETLRHAGTTACPIKKVDRDWKSDQELAAMIWDKERHRVAEMVLSCDLATLCKVAEVLGFTPDLEP
jgi:hypothetical protein